MKIIILLLFSLLVMQNNMTASNNKDSIKANEIQKLLILGRSLSIRNTDSTLLIYKQAVIKSQDLQDKYYLAFSLANYGVSLSYIAEDSNGIDTLKLSSRIAQETDSAYVVVYALSQIGTIYKKLGIYDSAFVYYNLAEQKYNSFVANKEVINERPLKVASILYTDFGLLYNDMNYFKDALRYYHKALKIAKQLSDDVRLAGTYINIANVYNENTEYYDMQKALKYYRKGQAICERINHRRYLANVYGNFLNIYTELNQLDSAEYYYKKSLAIIKDIHNDYSFANVHIGYATLLEKKGKYKQQIKVLEKGYAISKKNSYNKLSANYALKLAMAYNQLNQPAKAYNYLWTHLELQDSLYDQSINDKLMQLRISSLQEQKINAINLITKEKELLAAQKDTSAIINISLSLGSLILMLAAFFLYRANKQKSIYSSELEIKNEKLDIAIHDLSKYQKELEETNQSKDKFFSIIAHDLRNPLSSFITVTEFLNNDFDTLDNVEKKEFINDMFNSSKLLFGLLENLLYWSRSQMGVIEFNLMQLDVNYLVNQCVELLQMQANNKNITISTRLAENLLIKADANMLLTVIRNIISNAIKFTPKDGKITVSTGSFEKYVYIRVKDSGVGITEEKIKQLFEPSNFESNPGTNNEKGTGLGLVLCNEFIQKHKGRIDVISSVKEGSIFTILIPKN